MLGIGLDLTFTRVSELNASALVKYARNRYGGDAVDFYVVEICQEWILR